MADKRPMDDLCRAVMFAPTLERADGADPATMPTLTGRFAVFNQWTEINSIFEGRFLERMAPGAFKKTIREGRDGMRVLFQHGQDPQIGDKPLGPIKDLREDAEGAYYEVPLLDTGYVRELIPGLEQNLYGASFRFRVVKEEVVEQPEPSDYNPTGLPERTVKEAQVKEFGPVTFPAYEGATAGVRSLTDEFIFARFAGAAADPERLEQLVEFARAIRPVEERTTADAEPEREAPIVINTSADGEPAGESPLPEEEPADEGHSEDGSRAEDDDTVPEDEVEQQDKDAPPTEPIIAVTPTRSYLTLDPKNHRKEEPWRLQ